MELQYPLITIATIVQFILGALWYSPLLFGTWWMEIMEVTHVSKEKLKEMQKEMLPYYVLQLFLTFLFTCVLALAIDYIELISLDMTHYTVACYIWLGFIVPTQVSGIIWSNTKKKYWMKQIAIVTSYQLVGIMLAALVLSF